jgi:hypothetical protein
MFENIFQTFLSNFYPIFVFFIFFKKNKVKNKIKKMSEVIIYIFFVLLFIGIFKKMKNAFFFIKMVFFFMKNDHFSEFSFFKKYQ